MMAMANPFPYFDEIKNLGIFSFKNSQLSFQEAMSGRIVEFDLPDYLSSLLNCMFIFGTQHMREY